MKKIKLTKVSESAENLIQNLLSKAPTYQKNIQNVPLKVNAAKSLLIMLPDHCQYFQKHVLIVYHDEIAIGVVDLIFGYPNSNTAFLGLLLLDESWQKRGLGKLIYLEVEKYVLLLGNNLIKFIKLAVVENNPVLGFWTKLGFSPTGEKKDYKSERVVSFTISMQKEIYYPTIISTQWKTWQEQYRFGALYIFPPEEIRHEINILRKKYDPVSYSFCEAHLSLTVPFPKIPNAKEWSELHSCLKDFSPFDLSYGPLHCYPGVRGVVLKIEPELVIKNLVEMLEQQDLFRLAKPRTYSYSPHMTIAEFITMDQTHEIFQELSKKSLSGSFYCSEISYAIPDEHFYFTNRATLSLK